MQKLMDRDFLSALVLFIIGTVSLVNEGDDLMNWVFPRLATYFVLFVAAVLAVRVIFAETVKREPDTISVSPEDRLVLVDVFAFLSIVLFYLLVMYGLGFWLASFVMLSLASLYLTLDKTRKNIGLAVVVPLGICIVAYIIFLHVFYVPLPEARWWTGFG
jgi:lysylphosphatidylglycerol synthetase-like protein (DUF2156 family)